MQVKEDKTIGSCGCGRSPTGICVGWHALTETQYLERLTIYKNNQLKEQNNVKD